jgi:hypothetical protein
MLRATSRWAVTLRNLNTGQTTVVHVDARNARQAKGITRLLRDRNTPFGDRIRWEAIACRRA